MDMTAWALHKDIFSNSQIKLCEPVALAPETS